MTNSGHFLLSPDQYSGAIHLKARSKVPTMTIQNYLVSIAFLYTTAVPSCFAQIAVTKPELGILSAKYESGNRGPETVSNGKGDPGGVSYGTYQLASALGNAGRFVQKFYPEEFKGLMAGTAEFTKVWRETVDKDREAFHRNEHSFIKESHYDPQMVLIEKATGIKLNDRSAAFRDVVWSCAVHHGPRSKIIATAYKPAITDTLWIKAIYAERGRKDDQGKLVYFQRVADALIPSLTNRFKSELIDALKMLAAEQG